MLVSLRVLALMQVLTLVRPLALAPVLAPLQLPVLLWASALAPAPRVRKLPEAKMPQPDSLSGSANTFSSVPLIPPSFFATFHRFSSLPR